MDIIGLLQALALLAVAYVAAAVAARVIFPRPAVDEPFSRDEDWGDRP